MVDYTAVQTMNDLYQSDPFNLENCLKAGQWPTIKKIKFD